MNNLFTKDFMSRDCYKGDINDLNKLKNKKRKKFNVQQRRNEAQNRNKTFV